MSSRTFYVPVARSSRVLVRVPDKHDGLMPVVLALHGMGQSASELEAQLEPAIKKGSHIWVIPDGFLPLEKARDSKIGFSWYLFAGDQGLLKKSMYESCNLLLSVLDKALEDLPVATSRISVLGFSQGGYLGSVLGARNPARISSVGCAGGRLKHEFFPTVSERSRPAFLQLHGADDSAVSASLAERAVQMTNELGYRASMRTFPGTGHALTPAMIDSFLTWEATLT